MKKIKNVTLLVNSKAYTEFEKSTIGADKKVMLSILKYMIADFNIININGSTLKSISNETSMSESHIRNSISRLKKLYLIEPTRDFRGEYIVNPTFAFKGSESKVWHTYGLIERKTNKDVTVMAEGVFLQGEELEMKEEDYTKLGEETYEKRYIK